MFFIILAKMIYNRSVIRIWSCVCVLCCFFQKKEEFATDVIIPRGGTEELDSKVFEGHVKKSPTDAKVGCIAKAWSC